MRDNDLIFHAGQVEVESLQLKGLGPLDGREVVVIFIRASDNEDGVGVVLNDSSARELGQDLIKFADEIEARKKLLC